jgi:hypothetical protein
MRLRSWSTIAPAVCVGAVVLGAAVPAAVAQDDERPPGDPKAEEYREPLFFRFTFGPGAISSETEPPPNDGDGNTYTIAGPGATFALDLGISPAPTYAVHLRGFLSSVFDPTFSSSGGPSFESHDVRLFENAFGVAGTYYVIPMLYVTAVVGASQLQLDLLGEGVYALTDFGIWLDADIGFELPVYGGLRVGACARVTYATMDGGDGSDVEYSTAGAALSMTFMSL